jgi:uncharacterized protein YggE
MDMKMQFASALVLAAISAATLIGQPSMQPPLITVSGSAEVKIVPDEIDLRVGVETHHEALDQAKKESDERVGKALAFLKAANIRSEDIQTDYLAVEPRYENFATRTKLVNYVVQRSIGVKIRKVEGFESLLTGLLTNGISHVHGIEFRTSELRKHRDAARAMAVRAAREKADALATELGVKRGKVHTVNANEWGGWWSAGGGSWGHRFGAGMFQNVTQNAGGASTFGGDDTLSVGQISVSATVNVSFLIAD